MKRRPQPSCLYPREDEIAELVLGPNRLMEWRALAVIWEREGLPPIDPTTGGRFWEAVETWLRIRHRVVTMALGKPDGGETCPPARKKGRPASSSAPAATVHKFPTGAPEPT